MLTLQTINTGTIPNDGTGDSLRGAGSKINANNAALLNLLTLGYFTGTTSVSNSSGTTLTVTAILDGIILRSGLSGNSTDTTDTAANIVNEITNAYAGLTFDFIVLNSSAYNLTINGGTGVTVSGNPVAWAGCSRRFTVVLSNVTGGSQSVTIYGADDGLNFLPLNPSNNLGDIASASTARTNLGLGSLATLNSVNLASGVTGTLPVGNGGTGQTTANAALNALLPTQGASTVLASDGTNTSFQGITTAHFASNVVDNDPTLAADSSTRLPTQQAVVSYVSNAVTGLSWKQAVRVATTTNGTLSSAYANGQTVDGITLATNDRILIKNQSSTTDNGIYTVNASGAPTRSADANTGAELVGATVFVTSGTANASTQWTQTTPATITLGSSSIVFAQISGAGSYTAGTGLLLSANQFSIDSTVTTLTGTQTLTNKSIVATQLTGTLQAAQFPALTGNVTTTAGSLATTIGTSVVTNSMLAGSIDLTSKVTGALPVANGGTGQTTANTALNALLPTQTGNSGNFLTTNGTNTSWGAVTQGTVTSITAGTGLSGGTITASGTISVTTNGISNSLLRQGAATSVIGNSTGSTANVADIAATSDGQALVRKSGTLAFAFVGPRLDVRDYGAVPDCRRITDLVCTSSSTTITSAASANFTNADVGKVINIYDFNNNNYIARTTIASVSNATTATLTASASASLSSANGVAYLGTDNSTAIASALTAAGNLADTVSINANQPFGGGQPLLVFPVDARGNRYLFGSQQVVPMNVAIDADALLVSTVGLGNSNANGLANRNFAMIFKPGASIKNLVMDCCYTMGLQIGNFATQSHAYIDYLSLWSVGGNNASGNIATSAQQNTAGSSYVAGDTITLTGGTFSTAAVITVDKVSSGAITDWHISTPGNYSALPSNPVSQGSTSGSGTGAKFNLTFASNSHIGLEVCGNDYFINRYWVKGANIGVHFSQNNDTMCNHLFLIGCSTSAMVTSNEELQVANTQIDTGSFAGWTIDGSHNLRVNSNQFAINSTAVTYCLGLGQNDGGNVCSNLNLGMSFNRTGGDAVRVGNVKDSTLLLTATNAALYGAGGTSISNLLNFTGAASPSGVLMVYATCDTAITRSTGTAFGNLLVNGQLQPITLTDAATVTWDVTKAPNATITLGGNRTFAAPPTLQPGTYKLAIKQDGTGSRTITWNAAFRWSGASAPTLTTTAAKTDYIEFWCDGTNMNGLNINKNY